jgi:2'-5' RNA ligase
MHAIVSLLPKQQYRQVEHIWAELQQEYYSPAQWMPHITIGFGDITSENLPGIMHWLSERDFTWEFTVDNLAIIYDTESKQELHSRYEIRMV